MVDMGSIAAALTGLKTAGEIAKGFLQLRSDAERKAKVIELQSVILAAQSSAIAAQSDQFEMMEEVRQLREEVANARAWETEKLRYKLVSPYAGAMVYALQRSMSNCEPPHYLCTNCFKDGKPSILQLGDDKGGWSFFGCPVCKSQAFTGYRGSDTPKYAEELVSGGQT